jgi:hypothetical protein
MGKIYKALKRSGYAFNEKDAFKRPLNENALTSLEKKALGRAGRYYRLKDVSKRVLSQNAQIPSLNKIDSRLMDLGLSKDQISKQNIKELNKSLHQIDGYIAHPESFLKQNFRGIVDSETDLELNILPILLERRLFVLESYNELVSKMKIYDLRRLINGISDKNIKFSIEKILYDLQMKDSVLKKEYQKIEKLRRNLYFEQQKFSSVPKGPTERRNKKWKYFLSDVPVITAIMGTLLILIAFLIAITPFVNILVPDILNSTFLIILGFFFGQGIGRLASFREPKKIE